MPRTLAAVLLALVANSVAAQGAYLVADIVPGGLSSNPQAFREANGELAFGPSLVLNGPWWATPNYSDGTSIGTGTYPGANQAVVSRAGRDFALALDYSALTPLLNEFDIVGHNLVPRSGWTPAFGASWFPASWDYFAVGQDYYITWTGHIFGPLVLHENYLLKGNPLQVLATGAMGGYVKIVGSAGRNLIWEIKDGGGAPVTMMNQQQFLPFGGLQLLGQSLTRAYVLVGNQLWSTAGTSLDLVMSGAGAFVGLGSNLDCFFFVGDDGSGPGVWCHDGQSPPVLCKRFSPGGLRAALGNGAPMAEGLVVWGETTSEGFEPWLVTPVSGQSQLLHDIKPGPLGSRGSDFVGVGYRRVACHAFDAGGRGMFVVGSDGSAQRQSDSGNTAFPDPQALTIGSLLFYEGWEAATGFELWAAPVGATSIPFGLPSRDVILRAEDFRLGQVATVEVRGAEQGGLTAVMMTVGSPPNEPTTVLGAVVYLNPAAPLIPLGYAVAPASGEVSFDVAVPPNLALGASWPAQALVLEPTRLSASNGVMVTFGQ